MTNGYDRQDGHTNGFLMGLLTGTVIGAGLGMLFAPRAGSELRNQLADSAAGLGNAASERYRQASARVGEAVDELTDKGREVIGKVQDAVAGGLQEVERGNPKKE